MALALRCVLLILAICTFATAQITQQPTNTTNCVQVCVGSCNRTDSCADAKKSCDSQTKRSCAKPQGDDAKKLCSKTSACDDEFKKCTARVTGEFNDCVSSCRSLCLVNQNNTRSYKKRQNTLPADNADLTNMRNSFSELEKTKKAFVDNFEYCYQDTYIRGSRVADCPTGFVNDGATCRRPSDDYIHNSRPADCPSGYTNIGLLCHRGHESYGKCCTTIWSRCPCRSGFTNMGCHCARHVSTLGMDRMTCNRPGEWKVGARCYSPCREGYTNMGETCHKPVLIRGMDSMTCRSGEGKVGARCYPDCKSGYRGELEVCWMNCPASWTNCGLSCHKKGATGCAKEIGLTVFSGLMAAGSIAAMVVTGGAATPATKAANSARWAAASQKGKKLLDQFEQFKKQYEAFEKVYKVGSVAANLGETWSSEATAYFKLITTVNQLLSLLELADPTGLFGLAREMMAPKCTRLEQDWLVFAILG